MTIYNCDFKKAEIDNQKGPLSRLTRIDRESEIVAE